MNTNKKQRLKLPKYLAVVAKYVPHCLECGTIEGVQNAHYSGLYSERLGNGMSSKSHDYCVARLCHKCHANLDQYQHGNSDMRARWFVEYIGLTLAELLATQRQLIVVPKDLKQQIWISRIKQGLDRCIDGDANRALNYLASQRDYIEKNGR